MTLLVFVLETDVLADDGADSLFDMDAESDMLASVDFVEVKEAVCDAVADAVSDAEAVEEAVDATVSLADGEESSLESDVV